MELVFFCIAIFSTTIGAMSGMGGGIIIKPLMDAISGLDVGTVNFMSSCAVFAMAFSAVYRGRKDGIDIDLKISVPLAVGAAFGGVLGKYLFEVITWNMLLLQSSLLLILNTSIYFYLKIKHKVRTLAVEKSSHSFTIGTVLGGISAFLGIGGGPINVVVLRYFYSSTAQVTAKRSIFVILFSQISAIITAFLTGLPENLDYIAIFLMMVGGVIGAILGSRWARGFSEEQMDAFFKDVLVGIIVLNGFNLGHIL